MSLVLRNYKICLCADKQYAELSGPRLGNSRFVRVERTSESLLGAYVYERLPGAPMWLQNVRLDQQHGWVLEDVDAALNNPIKQEDEFVEEVAPPENDRVTLRRARVVIDESYGTLAIARKGTIALAELVINVYPLPGLDGAWMQRPKCKSFRRPHDCSMKFFDAWLVVSASLGNADPGISNVRRNASRVENTLRVEFVNAWKNLSVDLVDLSGRVALLENPAQDPAIAAMK